jgi:hypothetical protein
MLQEPLEHLGRVLLHVIELDASGPDSTSAIKDGKRHCRPKFLIIAKGQGKGVPSC